MKRWTKEEELYLRDNYYILSPQEIANHLERTRKSVIFKAHEMGVSKDERWSEEEIQKLKENYSTHSFKELMEILPGRNRNAIQLKASKLGITERKNVFDFRFFENIDTEEKAYWLGFFYADGFVLDSSNSHSRNYEAGIKLYKGDYKHLKKFNKSINGNLQVTFETRTCSFNGKPQESCNIRCYSKEMVHDLESHGCVQNKTFIIEVPDIDANLMQHFIRGFFDGDGCICTDSAIRKTVAINFCSASLKMLEQMRTILYKEGISSYITDEKGRNTYRLYIRGMQNADKMWNYMFSDATIYLDRKVEKKKRLYEEYDLAQRLLRRSEMAG